MATEMQFIHTVCVSERIAQQSGEEKLRNRNANVHVNRMRRTDAKTHESRIKMSVVLRNIQQQQ